MTITSRPATADQQKSYLQSIMNGTIPDVRPLFGDSLNDAIKLIETTAIGSKGNLNAIQKIIGLLSKSNEGLAQLLGEGDTTPLTQREMTEETSDIPPLPNTAQLPYIPMEELSPWITDYIDYSKKASPEGYEDFHLACALFVLSAVTARRICIPLASPQYTPLTFVLCARTTLFAKSTTAYAATRLMKDAGLGYLLGADETTPQKLLYDMAGHLPANYGEMDADRQKLLQLKLAMTAQRGWYYDEFNQLIDAMSKKGGGSMADFAGLLRKLDNCADEYTYATKGGGEDYIEKPYLALLASTTPANMARHMNKGAELWGDGTCARWLFACPPPNDFVTATMDMGIVEPPQNLIDKIQQLHTYLGIPKCYISEMADDKGEPSGKYQAEKELLPEKRVTMESEAYKAYGRYRIAMRALSGDRENSDLDGNYSRLPTFALRVAGMLAALENNDMIDLRIWTGAQQIMEVFRKNLHEAYSQTSLDNAIEESALEDMLIIYIKTRKEQTVNVRDIVREGPSPLRKLKTGGIKNLLIGLERAGIVSCKKEGKKEWYSLCSK